MNVLSRVLDGWCRYTAEWLSAVLRLVVTANVVAAVIAFPEWQRSQVWAMWIYLSAISKSGLHFDLASTASNFTKFRHILSQL